MNDRSDLTIAILAGGRSRRMGQDKALLPVDGEQLLVRITHRALESGYPVLVVGRPRPAEWMLDAVRFVEDSGPGAGPLRGIVTALREAGTDVIAIACDMPLLDAGALRWLGSMRESAADGIVVLREGKMEPLFSLYRLGLLPRFEARLAGGELSVMEAIAACDLRHIEVPPEIAGALLNVNTPEELLELRERLKSGG